MNYKELSNEDKIATIEGHNFWKNERAVIEPYIVALKANDSTVIAEFEAFGDHPYQIVLNRRATLPALPFMASPMPLLINMVGWSARHLWIVKPLILAAASKELWQGATVSP
jgi:hypothetical protein